MSIKRSSRDWDPDEPQPPGGRDHLWVGGAMAALVLVGATLTVVLVNQSDDIANRNLAAAHAAEIGAP